MDTCYHGYSGCVEQVSAIIIMLCNLCLCPPSKKEGHIALHMSVGMSVCRSVGRYVGRYAGRYVGRYVGSP